MCVCAHAYMCVLVCVCVCTCGCVWMCAVFTDDRGCTILDCLFNNEQEIYYVVDLLCWKGQSYYKYDVRFISVCGYMCALYMCVCTCVCVHVCVCVCVCFLCVVGFFFVSFLFFFVFCYAGREQGLGSQHAEFTHISIRECVCQFGQHQLSKVINSDQTCTAQYDR